MNPRSIPSAKSIAVSATLWISAEALMVLAVVAAAIFSSRAGFLGANGFGFAPDPASAAFLLLPFVGIATGAAHVVNLIYVQRLVGLQQQAALRLVGALIASALILPVLMFAAATAAVMLGVAAAVPVMRILSSSSANAFIVIVAAICAVIVGLTFAMVLREVVRSQLPVLEPLLIALRRVHYVAAVAFSLLPILWMLLVDHGWMVIGEHSAIALLAVAMSCGVAVAGWRRLADTSETRRAGSLMARSAIAMIVFGVIGAGFGTTSLK